MHKSVEWGLALVAILLASLAATVANAQRSTQESATRAMYKDMKLGKLDIHGDNATAG